MDDPELVSDYAVTDYVRLTAGDAAGLAELARSGLALGVLADEAGRPVQLLTRNGAAPLIQVEADTPMERMAAGDVIGLIDRGVPALVVVRDGRCAGLLTERAVSSYVMAHLGVTTGVMGEAAGDGGLAGDPLLVPLMLTCAVCGRVNRVLYFTDGQTRCTGGHLLKVTWD
jgi:hypothetical protein